MGLPDGLDAEVIIGYLMVFISSVIILVYLGYDFSWFIASFKKKKRGSKVVKGKESENGEKGKGKGSVNEKKGKGKESVNEKKGKGKGSKDENEKEDGKESKVPERRKGEVKEP
jgi:hypothetical protein